MKQPCGCCSGVNVVTPQLEINRPGLSAIAYRMGTHSTFLESMMASLSKIVIDVPPPSGVGDPLIFRPLKYLTTRDQSDPSIALLDAWATVADVLTFYQERIANEGYLLTATERRSILELARLVGYRLRPGIASSVYLAFTVTPGFSGNIPAGTGAQSVPGPGQTPQYFETSTVLTAQDTWNNMQPRLSRPQVITLGDDGPDHSSAQPFDTASDARTRDSIYFQGTSTNLKTGDALLIVTGIEQNQQVLRLVTNVNTQPAQNRTEVTLQEAPPQVLAEIKSEGVGSAVAAIIQPYISASTTDFQGDIASQTGGILRQLEENVIAATSGPGAAAMVASAVTQIKPLHDIAIKRNFTRLEPWLADLIDALNSLVEELATARSGSFEHVTSVTGVGSTDIGPIKIAPAALAALASLVTRAPANLANLGSILSSISVRPNLQPASSISLTRTVSQAFAPQSDIAPKLVAKLNPTAAPLLYSALGSVEPAASPTTVNAIRAKASLFASSFAGAMTLTQLGQTSTQGGATPSASGGNTPAPSPSSGTTSTTTFTAPSLNTAWQSLLQGSSNGYPLGVALDATYDQIKQGSWIAIDRPAVDANGNTVLDQDTNLPVRIVTYHQVQLAQAQSMDTGSGFTAKVTVLTVNPPWLGDSPEAELTNALGSPAVLRATVVYAQAEPLDLAEEPLDTDVEGTSIELDGLYSGLESGRWVIVSGERTDIPGVTGVTASELVMMAGVTHGPSKQSCLAFTTTAIPFKRIYYVTEPDIVTDSTGNVISADRLVVGEPDPGLSQFLEQFQGGPSVPNQQICDPLQLAPGFWANAYVPTAAELSGDFGDVLPIELLDPSSPFKQLSYDGKPNNIPPDRVDAKTTAAGASYDSNEPRALPVYAWRISSLASGSDTPHTTLMLANKGLAYSYDRSNVTVYGNVVAATNGQTTGEVLGNGDASQSFQTFMLHQSPLTYVSAATPSGAQSTLDVTVNEIDWQEQDNLLEAGPTGQDYITSTNDSGQTSVTFGNGKNGARVPTGTANVKAVYRYGIGSGGNVAAAQISQLATRPLGAQSVINPLPATGGADPDSRDQARGNVPMATLALDRLVSVEDYADFARTFAGIGKAVSARLSDGRRLLVQVTIAGAGDIPIDSTSSLYQNLFAALQQYGDPYLPLLVCIRKVKLLVISAGIGLLPNYHWDDVEPNIRAALEQTFSFDSRELGQSAFQAEAISAMQAIEGVAYVNLQIFDSVSEDITPPQLAALSTSLRLRNVVVASLARVCKSLDPATITDPCQRVMPAELVFLTPDIPDTLILTQITGPASPSPIIPVTPIKRIKG